MKTLSTLERAVLETVNRSALTYDEIQHQTGLHENVCFNIIQALIIRGILSTDGMKYKVNANLSPAMKVLISGLDSQDNEEALELIEAVQTAPGATFKISKLAMDSRDHKIFMAMLSNLETFLLDAHKKAERVTPMKDRKIVFWGVSDVQSTMSEILKATIK